jgi:MinD superfamily P-loop ATPase
MPDHPTPPRVPRVDESLCQRCRKCVARKECRVKAIVALDPGEAPFIDASLCYGCLVCVPACPYGAIRT